MRTTFTGGHTFTRDVSGTAYLQINSGTSSIAPGWSVGGIDKLQTVGTSDVLWLHGAGGKEFFRSLGSGAYLSPVSNFGSLVKNGDNTYTYTDKFRTKTHFDTSGYQTKIVDAHGLITTYTHVSAGGSTKPEAIIKPDGTRVTFTYNGSRLDKVTLPGSRVVTVTTDILGNITGFTNPDGGLRTFTYDGVLDKRLATDRWGSRHTTYAWDSTTLGLKTITLDASTAVQVRAANQVAVGAATAKSASDAVGTLKDGLNRLTTYTMDSSGLPTAKA